MSEISYRQATEADFPAIATMFEKMYTAFQAFGLDMPEVENFGDIYVESFRRTLGRFSVFFVAELDGQVVGFQSARIKRMPPYLGGAIVGETVGKWTEPHARRRGIGKKLVRLVVEWLREQGAHSIETPIPEGNTASLNLFKSLGYKPEWRMCRLKWENYLPEDE